MENNSFLYDIFTQIYTNKSYFLSIHPFPLSFFVLFLLVSSSCFPNACKVSFSPHPFVGDILWEDMKTYLFKPTRSLRTDSLIILSSPTWKTKELIGMTHKVCMWEVMTPRILLAGPPKGQPQPEHWLLIQRTDSLAGVETKHFSWTWSSTQEGSTILKKVSLS